MTLKTINNTVKIRTTTIVNGDMGFSFLSNPYTYMLAGRYYCFLHKYVNLERSKYRDLYQFWFRSLRSTLWFPLHDKTLTVSNRCLQNPYKKSATACGSVLLLLLA